MALKAFDGFDHYTDWHDLSIRTNSFLQWNDVQTIGSGFVTGRNGHGKAWDGSMRATFQQRVASAFIGISTYMVQGVDVQFTFLDTLQWVISIDSPQTQIYVVFRSRNFSIQVVRVDFAFPFTNFVEVAVTGNNVWGANTWHFIEIWPVIDPVNGSIIIHIDQEEVLNVSGINTQATTHATWDGINFTGAQAWDDFYYADTTVGPGSNPCNNFLGDPRAYTVWPASNSSVQFTPLANTNWQEVSEIAFDGDTNYNFDNVVGHEDLFVTNTLPSTLTSPLAYQITGAWRKDDAGLREIKHALKSGATEAYGTSRFLQDNGYAFYSDLWATDPNTSSDWTLTTLNAALIGYNLAV